MTSKYSLTITSLIITTYHVFFPIQQPQTSPSPNQNQSQELSFQRAVGVTEGNNEAKSLNAAALFAYQNEQDGPVLRPAATMTWMEMLEKWDGNDLEWQTQVRIRFHWHILRSKEYVCLCLLYVTKETCECIGWLVWESWPKLSQL